MLVLRCTGKMLKRLGEKPRTAEAALTPNSPGEWYINVIDWLENGRVAICVNARVRYALLIPLDGVETPAQLANVLTQRLFRHLLEMEVPQGRIEEILTDYHHVLIAKTASRSILGTMNDMLDKAYAMIEISVQKTGSFSLRKLESDLNTMPQEPIGWGYAREEMWRICTENIPGAGKRIIIHLMDDEMPYVRALQKLVGPDLADKLEVIMAGIRDVLFSRDELRHLCDVLPSLKDRYEEKGGSVNRKGFSELYDHLSRILKKRL